MTIWRNGVRNGMIHHLTIVLFACIVLMVQPCMGQQELTEDERNAIESIEQRDVIATLSFLASDEMAGRDTPSPELTIAEAYVASRFRGAGLVGGVDGSFFQVHELATEWLPVQGIELRLDGQAVAPLGVLEPGPDGFEFTGAVSPASLEEGSAVQEFDGAAWVEPGELVTPRDQFLFVRQSQQLRRRGATCVLVAANDDSPLLAMAARTVKPHLVDPRRGARIPIVLVEEREMPSSVELKLPALKTGSSRVRNVIGVLPGSDPELQEEAIVFSAHLDHIGVRPGLPDPIFNGADDDASGVTGVIELANAYSRLETRPQRTLIFMTFWGEERGLLGSRYYVDNPTWPLEKIVANINIEMIGRPETGAAGKVWMTGWEKSDLGQLMAPAAERVGVTLFEHPQFSSRLYGASDNFSFVQKGVIAHSFSAGSLHDDYHQPSDEFEKIDTRHMSRVIQGLMAGTLPLARGQQTPKSRPSTSR